MVVSPDSALLQLPDYMEEKVPVDGDHYTIVKFDSKTNSTYTSVLEKLREFEKDAPRVVSTRFGKQPDISILPKLFHVQTTELTALPNHSSKCITYHNTVSRKLWICGPQRSYCENSR